MDSAGPEWLAAQQAAGRPIVRFGDIPLEWTDFRLTLRQTADILHRYEALDRAEHEQILALGRDGNALEPLVTQWYLATSGVEATPIPRRAAAPTARRRASIRCCVLALRPFLARCAEALLQRVEFVDVAPRALPVLRLGAGLRRRSRRARSGG